jgi:short-subunit dehydrogenase
MAQRDLTGRRALVTGASSGIGWALALELARQGVDLILVARRAERLAQLAHLVQQQRGGRAIPVPGDITDESIRQKAIETAARELGGLDILINNAGINAHGRFATASPSRLRPIFEVNFFAPAELIRAALPLLREGKRPVIVNIGSILGERGCPHKSEYSASKFALHGFSEAIRAELAGDGIGVLVVAAGPTATEHVDHLLEVEGELPWGEPQRMLPDQVASAIVQGIKQRRKMIVPGWKNRIWLCLNRIAPRLVDRIMARYG